MDMINDRSVLITTTMSCLDLAKNNAISLKQIHTDVDIYILIVDEINYDEDNSIFTILKASEILNNYLKRAFSFDESEFVDYVMLATCEYLLHKGYSKVFSLKNNVIFHKKLLDITFYDTNIDDSIWILQKNIENKELDENSSSTILKQNEKNMILSMFIFHNGPKVRSYLKWCMRQYDFIYHRCWEFHLDYTPERLLTRKHMYCTVENIFIKNLIYLDIFKPLCGWQNYIKFQTIDKNDYKFNYFTNGTPISYLIRGVLSSPYAIADSGIINPFASLEELATSSIIYENKHTIPITTAMQLIYDRRVDLQRIFPNYRIHDRLGFAQWFINNAGNEYSLAAEFITPIQHAVTTTLSKLPTSKIAKVINKLNKGKVLPTKYPFGVNLCGFICGDFGLAEATRLLAKTLEAADIPFTIISYTGSSYHTKNNTDWKHKISNEFIYNTNIMLTGGGGGREFPTVTSPDMYSNRYNIGYWYWELPEFYEEWKENFNFVDEIWTSGDFSKNSFQSQTDKPVKVIPLCMDVKVDSTYTRSDFNLPDDKFIFLMMYDVRSIQKRKNPQAAVNAFINEFKEDENAVLAIKINAPKDWNGENELLNSISHLKNVIVINQTFEKPVVNALIKCCDCYVSLHRSEGLGLGPAESMYLGRPAIMTGWSGNMEYATNENSCLVDYEIVELDQNYPPYKKGCHWAEPKVESASAFMRKLFEDKKYYEKIAKNGYKTMHEDFDAKLLGEKIKDRLKETQNLITDTVYKNLIK